MPHPSPLVPIRAHSWLLLLSISLLPLFAKAADKPNILVFLVDDMGVMDTSVPFLKGPDGKPKRYPLNDLFRTPSMQRLAKSGIRFSTFYANSVCSPSRTSLMTGQSSARHHTTQYIKPESNNAGTHGPQDWAWKGITDPTITLPGVLRNNGYRTIHAGKAHFGPVGAPAENPQHIGFDVNIAGCAWGQPGSYYGTENFGHGKKRRVNRAVPGLGKYHGQDINLTEALTVEINAEIKNAIDAKKPFFAYMSHYAVHAPFQPDKRFLPNYTDRTDIPKNARAFASMIESMDKSLGDILDHLEKLGVAENTLVFFLGDNGSDAPLGKTHDVSCAAPLRGKKGTHYEGGMRVPFIASWAKPDGSNPHQQRLPIPANILTDQIANITDLYPTVLSATGIDNPNNHTIDGENITNLIRGASPKRDATFLMHFPHQHRSSYFTAYRSGSWKLIYHYHKPEAERTELFNLDTDPFESTDLSRSDPATRDRLIKQMAAALEAADAQYPTSKNSPAKQLRPE